MDTPTDVTRAATPPRSLYSVEEREHFEEQTRRADLESGLRYLEALSKFSVKEEMLTRVSTFIEQKLGITSGK
jgi:hypothetical protein